MTRDNGERYCICVGSKCNNDNIEAFVLAALLRSGADFSGLSAASAVVFSIVAAVNFKGHHALNDWRS